MSYEKYSDDNYKKLIELLAAREMRQAERAAAVEKIHNERILERTPFRVLTERFNFQKNCKHLKGRGRAGLDYNVRLHTFIDGSQQIKCMNGCGWEVWNKKNWRFKWAFGMGLVKYSTNTPTSSEQFAGTKRSDDDCLPEHPKRIKTSFDDKGGRTTRAVWE